MPYVRCYTHFVWATWDRLDLIEPSWEAALHADIYQQSHKWKARVLALNGVENHVHLLAALPATIAIATFVGEVKGGSSFFVNAHSFTRNHFQWQGSYAAFSVSRWDVPKIRAYIDNQKEHHRSGTTDAELELPPLHVLKSS